MGNDLQMPTGRDNTGNPQQVGQAGLQSQSASLLQPSSSLTINGLNQIDQSSAAIALSPATSATTTTSTPVPGHAQTGWAYTGLMAIAIIVAGSIIYGLLRHQ